MARFDAGWVSMERKILLSDIGKDSHLFCIWSTLIAWANVKSSTTKFAGKPLKLNPGELVTSHDELARQWHFSRSVVKRCLDYLNLSQRIELQSSNKGTFIKVLNYSKYQDGDRTRRQQTERKIRNNRATIDHQSIINRAHSEQGNKETINKEGGGQENSPSLLTRIWNSYSEGYEATYGVRPLKTAIASTQVAELATIAGADAPGIAKLYAVTNRPYWRKRLHNLKVCIEDIDQIHTAYLQSKKSNGDAHV